MSEFILSAQSGCRRQAQRRRSWIAVALALVTVAGACGGEGDATSDRTGSAGAPSVEAWCSNMVDQKARLREQYAEVFAAAPNGDDTPSSALLSLDGSAASASSLRAYVATLTSAAPTEIASAAEAAVEQLDELLGELEASPDQPGNAAIGGLGAVGEFYELDRFAIENCGETI